MYKGTFTENQIRKYANMKMSKWKTAESQKAESRRQNTKAESSLSLYLL